MRTPQIAACVLGFCLISSPTFAQNFVEIRQDSTRYNYRTTAGVPLSSVVSVPPGSDGRIPVNPPVGETTLPPSPNQFQGVMPFGGLVTPSNPAALNQNLGYAANAALIGLPAARLNNVPVVVLSSARLGAPILSRKISFQFGSAVPVPAVDAAGAPLTNILPAAYWQEEPHTINGHAGAAYYYSPHARTVFAIQAGPVDIVWRVATPDIFPQGNLNEPPGFIANVTHFKEGAAYFKLLSQRYIVSGSAVKTPQKMFWTEGVFRDTGKAVNVPSARVSAVKVVYNNNFPAKVAQEFVADGQSFVTDQNNLIQELRTLWFDNSQKQVRAYNVEGRAFVELLGDTKADGVTKQHLGFEIVDVARQPNPADVTAQLGDLLRAYSDGRDDSALFPELLLGSSSQFFNYQRATPGSDRLRFYATRETVNLNDVLIHWLKEGLEGLRWPLRMVRYRQVWPTDVARYSHYVRPLVATDAEARLTAVQLPTDNAPVLEYQDPLDRPRGALTDQFSYYSFLDASFPAHRALIRYSAGENVSFERVFSWLDQGLKTPSQFANSVATNLMTWDAINSAFKWSDIASRTPRVVTQSVNVGDRIQAPVGELGAGANDAYLAGHIHIPSGNAYHPTAYTDPLTSGFEEANLGAIIPVNAILGKNALEVWWFRPNNADLTAGFKKTEWPAVIGRYTIQWPLAATEIVLASNDGSGGLGSLEAKGSIYSQNDSTLAGYNPNEEHGLMLGGQAYALRDDLNITQAPGYTSEPYVLLDFTGPDGRPSMRPFKVLREKPQSGILFDYIAEAGTLLQAPMPLPLLPAPVEGVGASAINYNAEPPGGSADLPTNWDPALELGGPNAHYEGFTYRDRKDGFWVYRGLHAGLPALEVGTYDAANSQFLPPGNVKAVLGTPFTTYLHASRQLLTLVMTNLTPLPDGMRISGLSLTGIPTAIGSQSVTLRVTDTGDGSFVEHTFTFDVIANGAEVRQGPLTITSTNGNTGTVVDFVNRPPYLAVSPTLANSFTMRFYYKTQAGFDWPGHANPPAVGSIVPYLLPLDGTGAPIGDPGAKTTTALDIVYRPTWPASAPTLAAGQTLMLPTTGLPAARGQSSLQVLYQQSVGADFSAKMPSVTLHDPTREKSYDISRNTLNRIPAGVLTDNFQGLTFFTALPPHLADRVLFDPARGTLGHLVLRGEFRNEIFGEKYVLLNVLGVSDLATVKSVCPAGDPDKAKWDQAVDGLTTTVETFYENPAVPGAYIPNPILTRSVGVSQLAEVTDDDTAVDSYALSAAGPGSGFVTLIAANGRAFTPEGDPVSMYVIRAKGPLHQGELKVLPSANPLNELLTLQHTADLAARTDQYEYDWRIAPPVDGLPVPISPTMTGWQPLATGTDVSRVTLGGTAGIQVLVDNYITMRYRPINANHPLVGQWSDFTRPQLAEGWIKRVLAGINPFNQRVTDLFSNSVNTDASILSQAGKRWEGAIALNLETINQFGLIEIYETVLRRGRALSIDAGINFGPANDALLLAAGYLNDLYMLHGDEAYVDAANPTIGIGTANNTYGDIATALFSFKGQTASLLEEELALLRGRDEFLQPGSEISPVYNRLVWNYTRGINSGEIIYALNYDILDQDFDGVVGPADAAHLYPQGHGDAYGHYLTALKGYYSLLLDTDFDWVPRIEAVTVLGQPVSVDYFDERKFAAAAAAVARTGRQVFDLTWRQEYQSGSGNGWEHLGATRSSAKRTRHWGADHWASRTGQGAYVNWLVGNAILPDVDPDPTHEGIQKVDRTTVPELQRLPSLVASLQTDLDNAEAGLTPLGLPETSVAFDLNPDIIVGSSPRTHFEQILERAKSALRNALVAFDDAKDVTRLLRSEQDSLNDLQAAVRSEELSFTNSLISLYGTPYPEDMGPGKLYASNYGGPDFFHHAYVDDVRLTQLATEDTGVGFDFSIYLKPSDPRLNALNTRFLSKGTNVLGTNIVVHLDSSGFYSKPANYIGRRRSPGKLQEAIGKFLRAHNETRTALEDSRRIEYLFTRKLDMFESKNLDDATKVRNAQLKSAAITAFETAKFAFEMLKAGREQVEVIVEGTKEAIQDAIPDNTIAGVAVGGDLLGPAEAAAEVANTTTKAAFKTVAFAKQFALGSLKLGKEQLVANIETQVTLPMALADVDRNLVYEIETLLEELRISYFVINQRLQELDNALKNYQTLLADGDRLLTEREIFRQRSASVIQGFRTRDAAFRLFRSEKLDRYKALFDLAAQYCFMAAQAYDYETGQLGTPEGRSFVNRIVNSRALGVMVDGEPQFAGSDTGDPGLSSVLAEMQDDWLVLKSRLGFNNADAYGTTVSLRTENLRILPTADGDLTWHDYLQRGRKANLLDDADVDRYCLQIESDDGLPVPGIILEFGTTIADGLNLFGRPSAAGDHGFSPAFFATKIFAAGVAFEGYQGMDNPVANGSIVIGVGGTSPTDPTTSFLDQNAMFATPYIYLIPVGVDSMRSPPLGDVSTIRTWSIDDVTIPLPFNIGASDFSSKQLWQESDSLAEQLFSTRKHQPFRPVSSVTAFGSGVYGEDGLARSQFTNTRLVGRSIWNSKWKIVIPGRTLLNDPNEGLERFIRTVKDVKLHFVTYSYSGN